MRPLSIVWSHFLRKREGSKVTGTCRYCGAVYYTNAHRMMRHLLKCEGCPNHVKESICQNGVLPPPMPRRKVNNIIRTVKPTFPVQALQWTPFSPVQQSQPATSAQSSVPLSFQLMEGEKLGHGPSATIPAEINHLSEDKTRKEHYEEWKRQQWNNDGIGQRWHHGGKEAEWQNQRTNNSHGDEEVNEQLNLQLKIARAIFTSNSPLSLIENIHFKDFVNSLKPSLQIPSKHLLTGYLLDRIYDEAKRKVDKRVSECQNIVILSSGWSCLTADNLPRISLSTPEPLYYKLIKGGNENLLSVENIVKEFEGVIEELGSGRILGVVTDSAKNIIKSQKILKKKYKDIVFYRCAAHNLQLLCKDLEKIPSISNHIASVKYIVRVFKQKHTPARVFRRIKDEKYIKENLCLSSKHKWGSTLNMLESLQQNKDILQTAVNDECVVKTLHSHRKVIEDIKDVSGAFWKQNERAISVLKPVVSVMVMLEGETTLMSQYINFYRKLEKEITNNLAEMGLCSEEQELLLQTLSSRYKVILSKTHKAAYLLDPRFCGELLTCEEKEEAIEEIAMRAAGGAFDTGTIVAEVANYLAKAGRFKSPVYWAAVKKIGCATWTATAWWTGLCTSSPLSSVAVRLLSLPASSSASRSSGQWPYISCRRRKSLNSTQVARLEFVSHNFEISDQMENFSNEVEEADDLDDDDDDDDDSMAHRLYIDEEEDFSRDCTINRDFNEISSQSTKKETNSQKHRLEQYFNDYEECHVKEEETEPFDDPPALI
ncbi:uncharacterized protein LOC143026249 [Oratosquilla oratoria]|uniref:uncharacterized protein LOC143026249 n=1 Tax=Oratosquilla oratoria TaxID=337810 RepID=UPI003F75B2E1